MSGRFGGAGQAGFSFLEVLTVLVVAAIVLGSAVPKLFLWIETVRARMLLERVVGDLHAARALALRHGERVEVRFLPGSRPACFGAYEMVLPGPPERTLYRAQLTVAEQRLCLTSSNSAPLRFDSRGTLRGFGNRTLSVRYFEREDSLVVSAVGRVRRTFRRRLAGGRKTLPGSATPSARTPARTAPKRDGYMLFRAARFFLLGRTVIPIHGTGLCPAGAPPGALRPRGSRRVSHAGHSLIEVLAAMLIFALSGLVLPAITVASSRQIERAVVHAELAHAATQVMERAKWYAHVGYDPLSACLATPLGRVEIECGLVGAGDAPGLPVGMRRLTVAARATPGTVGAGEELEVVLNASLW
jgi:prepilin-type N-terminal cleavage/methylation domain-containing protein